MNEIWQKVDSDGYTRRLRVDGGWLYRYNSHQGVAMCFVPNPTYSHAIPYNTPGQGSPNYVH